MLRNDTGAGIASPQLAPLTDSLSHVDEKSAVPLSDREIRLLPSRSSSTISRFVDRVGTGVYGLSSLRTISSWRNTFPRAHKTYAKVEQGHDVGSGGSDSDSLSSPRLRGGLSPSQHSSSGNPRNRSLRRRRRSAAKSSRSQNNTPLADLLARFSHAVTNSTSGHLDLDSDTSTS